VTKPTKPESALIPETGWLTLKQAATLSNTTVDRLRAMIRSGDLRAYTVERDGKKRFRLDRSSLAAAGLLETKRTIDPTASFDLFALVRDQNERIARLEDQRAQLSGQLGVTLERLRSIDERVIWLEEHEHVADEQVDNNNHDNAIVAVTTSRFAPAIARLPQRPTIFVTRSFRILADTARRRGESTSPIEDQTL